MCCCNPLAKSMLVQRPPCAFAFAAPRPPPSPPPAPPAPPAPPPGPPPPPYALIYHGCYAFEERNFVRMLLSNPQTIEGCFQVAAAAVYPIFGARFGQCWVADNLTLATSAGTSAGCTEPCYSNAAQTCGGYAAVSIYESLGGCSQWMLALASRGHIHCQVMLERGCIVATKMSTFMHAPSAAAL